jgi:hypothetical protein
LWDRIELSDDQTSSIRHGKGLSLAVGVDSARLRAYDQTERFIALLEFDSESGLWHPQKVFH